MIINFRSIVDSLTVPTFVIGLDHTVLAWNRACELLTGIKAEDIIGTKEAWRGFYTSERPCLVDVVVDSAESKLSVLYPVYGSSKFSRGSHAESWFENINGKKRYLIFDAEPIYGESGQLIGGVENLEDVTEIKEVEERLMLSDKVFSYTNQSILITDSEHRIIQANKAFSELTGYEFSEVLGQNLNILQSEHRDEVLFNNMYETLNLTGHWVGEIWGQRRDGSVFPKWLSINKVADTITQQITHYVVIFTDITERKRNEEKVRHLAFHDTLTELPNRILFLDRLEQAISDSIRNQSMVALLFIDLDRFKIVNDTLGHHIGDLLLKEVASRLKNATRETDTVARLGGDEFVIILPDLQHESSAGKVARQLLRNFDEMVYIDDHELYTTLSIGISIFPIDGMNSEMLMQSADTAMYHVKGSGKNNYQYFTHSMTEIAKERAKLEKDLRSALEKNELELHFQPKISTNPQRVVGCEALLRWKHPTQGYIPPDKFIPIAEEAGLIVQIGEWVMDEAARCAAQWCQHGLTDFSMAINLSPSQFKDDTLSDKLRQCIDKSTLTPDHIELEITENVFMNSIQASSDGLVTLKQLGVRLAIDDFGTGYSSLSYLKSFDINTLKIDKSFVNDIHTKADSAAIVSAVISLAHNLGLTVVAEGVETEEQLAFLEGLNCDIYQGYLFSRPLPADAFFEYTQQQICAIQHQPNISYFHKNQ